MNDRIEMLPPLPEGRLIRAAIRVRLREIAALQRRDVRMRRFGMG